MVAIQTLRQYFLCHPIVVKRDLTTTLELRKPLKAHTLADFIVETATPIQGWCMLMALWDLKESGVGLLLENNVRIVVEMSLKFPFPTSINKAYTKLAWDDLVWPRTWVLKTSKLRQTQN